MPNILILNGPNLNMLGRREPAIYGTQTLADIKALCEKSAKSLSLSIDFRQSNYEGELVTWIQEAMDKADAVVINAAGYTHTSIAIHDALKMLSVPVVEVHLSDPKSREAFRHHSFIEPVASHSIAGMGADGYVEAIAWLSTRIK
jgi:3-dehydroquinate dehydratase-2